MIFLSAIQRMEESGSFREADAVVNPKQNDCLYPNKNICGAVVAWKLIWALYERLGIDSDEIWDFLELAAIATVGDVMDLQGENRIIVKEGLKKTFFYFF